MWATHADWAWQTICCFQQADLCTLLFLQCTVLLQVLHILLPCLLGVLLLFGM
jgi:hypothetical protein